MHGLQVNQVVQVHDRKRKRGSSCHDEEDCGNMINDVGPDPMFYDENGEPITGGTGLQG